MTAAKFVPTENLDSLTSEQLQAYYLKACEFYKLPPELNVLTYAWMENGDTGRHRVLYAKKGATDIFRDHLGIDTIELTKDDGPGYVSFTAVGKNKHGRIERAVGAVGTEGLKGQTLAAAVMTAQTRALRRMTLQFMGGGLLDETEVQETTTDIKNAPALREIAPMIPPVQTQPSPLTHITGDPAKDFPPEARAFPTKAQLEAQEALATVKPEVLAKVVDEYQEPHPDFKLKEVGEPVQNPPAQGVSLQEISKPEFAPKRRSRKQEQVSFEVPFTLEVSPKPTVSAPVEVPPIIETPLIRADATVPEVPLVRVDVLPPKVAEAVFPIAPESKPVLDAVTIKGFRDRLFKYTSTVFPKAGMLPSVEGGGIAQKVRTWALSHFKVSLNDLNQEQWESMFSYWDEVIAKSGAAALVKVIDDVAEGHS